MCVSRQITLTPNVDEYRFANISAGLLCQCILFFFFHFRNSVDIIGIGESRTMPEITGCELALDGYRLFRKDQLDIGLEGLCYMLGAI